MRRGALLRLEINRVPVYTYGVLSDQSGYMWIGHGPLGSELCLQSPLIGNLRTLKASKYHSVQRPNQRF